MYLSPYMCSPWSAARSMLSSIQLNCVTGNHNLLQTMEQTLLLITRQVYIFCKHKLEKKMHMPASENHQDASTGMTKLKSTSCLPVKARLKHHDMRMFNHWSLLTRTLGRGLGKIQHPSLAMLCRTQMNPQLQVNWRARIIDRHSRNNLFSIKYKN
jgi:hypothetical protein